MPALVNEPGATTDEPLSALDFKNFVQTCNTKLRELQQRLGITSIFVTHDQEEALAMSDELPKGSRSIRNPVDITICQSTVLLWTNMKGRHSDERRLPLEFVGKEFECRCRNASK